METTEIVKLVLDFIEKTGSAMVLTGFPIAVRFVIANAIGNLLKTLVYLAISIISYKISMKNFSLLKTEEDWGVSAPSFPSIKAILFTIFTAIMVLCTILSNPFESVKMLISPEWYAIINIIRLVK